MNTWECVYEKKNRLHAYRDALSAVIYLFKQFFNGTMHGKMTRIADNNFDTKACIFFAIIRSMYNAN